MARPWVGSASRRARYRHVTLAAAILLALIIVSGAAVRLTGSGLGCPEWPNCTAGKLTAGASDDVHAQIEFANRMVTGLVSLAVIVAVLGSLVRLPRRKDLIWLSVGLVVGVVAQALLGALVVSELLDPPFVMGHFLLSAVLLADAIVLYHRAGIPDDMRSRPALSPGTIWLGRLLVLSASVVLVTGTVVTGAGPHSGDAGTNADLKATRLNFAVPEVARIHGTTVMVFLALTLITLWVVSRQPGTRPRDAAVGASPGPDPGAGRARIRPVLQRGAATDGGVPRRGRHGGVQRHARCPPGHVRTRTAPGGPPGTHGGPGGGGPGPLGRLAAPGTGHPGAPAVIRLRVQLKPDARRQRGVPTRFSPILRPVAVLIAVSAITFGLAGPAAAEPSGTASGTRNLGVLNEQYNLTRLRLERASAALAATQARLDATKTRVEGVKAVVRARSARLYLGASGDGIAAVLHLGSVNELGRRTQYVAAAAKPDRALLATLSQTLDRLDAQQQAAAQARDRLKAEADAAAAARRKLMEEAAAAARTQPRGDGAGPVGTPRAMLVASSSGSSARTAASPAATPAATAAPAAQPAAGPAAPTTPPPTAAPTPSAPAPPAPSSRAATAVAFARAQLGKPYVFATAGPNSFDCSGLTKAAWAAAGVYMDHYSGSQANAFPRVSWNQLQPGDIVVFYSDYHHVGLYIGGGSMIHVPQTGDVVKIAPAWRENFQFGVRPG